MAMEPLRIIWPSCRIKSVSHWSESCWWGKKTCSCWVYPTGPKATGEAKKTCLSCECIPLVRRLLVRQERPVCLISVSHWSESYWWGKKTCSCYECTPLVRKLLVRQKDLFMLWVYPIGPKATGEAKRRNCQFLLPDACVVLKDENNYWNQSNGSKGYQTWRLLS
jgi:hypothetical protein